MRVLARAFLALLLAAPASAQPYRWVDEHGGVHYADRPPRPAPADLQNLNPAARQRRVEPLPATPTPAQPSPAPEATPGPEPPTARRVAPPPVEPRPMPAELGPSSPAPEPGGEDSRGDAREVMELAGIDRYVEDLTRVAQGDLTRLAWSTREPDAAWAALVPVVRRDVMAAATAAALARRLEAEHLPAVLVWLRSPEHLRIRQAEIEAAKPASQPLYRRFVAGLVETNARLPHLALIQQLQRAGRGADRHLALERALRQAMRRAVAPLATRSRVDDDSDDDGHTRAEERTRFWRVTGTLFAFRGLGSAQIEAAVRFERSPAGVWFTTVAWESLAEAVAVVEQRAAAAIRAVAARSLSGR